MPYSVPPATSAADCQTSSQSTRSPFGTAPGSPAPSATSIIPPPNAPSGPRGWQEGAKWDCDVCQRSFKASERNIHVTGKPHQKRLVAWIAATNNRMLAENDRKNAERGRVGMPGSSRSAGGVQASFVTDAVAQVARVAPVSAGLWECAVCERSMMSMSKASHLMGNPHAMNQIRREEEQKEKQRLEQEELGRVEQVKNEAEKEKNEEIQKEELRRTEEIRIEEQQKKVQEESRIAELIREEMRKDREQREREQKERDELQRIEIIRAEDERRQNEEKERVECQRIEMIRTEEERRQKGETERVESQRGETIRIEEEAKSKVELQRIGKEKEQVEFQRAEMLRMEDEILKSQEDNKKNMMDAQFRIEEQNRMRVERLRINEEESNRVRKAKLDQETVAAADKELRITQENQRAEWMREQEEAAVAARQMEGQLRIEQEDRRKEWLRKQEDQASVAWRMEEQLRIEEEKRRKEWMKKQEEQTSAAWRMEEQLRIEEENRRRLWFGNQEEEAAEAWQIGEYLRLEQEKSRKESTRKLAEAAAAAAAAEHTRREQLRKHEEEAAWRKQELQIVEEREHAQRMTERLQVELERRRMEDVEQQQHVTDRLAREHLENIRNLSSPGSSIGPTGWLQQGSPIDQHSGQGGPSIYDSGAQVAYLQWQEMMQEMHQQQLWLPQPVTVTFPMPVTSAIDLPPILYRVYDETSVSKYSWEGFTAASSFMPQDTFHFRNMVNLHGNWSSREGTPFISVTSSPDAVAWHVGIRQASRNQPNIMVALIDTATLLGSCQASVWKMHDARDHFGLQPWKYNRRAFDNEYICALRIPARAIFACCKPHYFKQNALMFLETMKREILDPSGERGL